MSIDVLHPQDVHSNAMSLGIQSNNSNLKNDSSIDAGGGMGNCSPRLSLPSNLACSLGINSSHS
eukprot:10790071-Prorocentrum_lima.AAC.1